MSSELLVLPRAFRPVVCIYFFHDKARIHILRRKYHSYPELYMVNRGPIFGLRGMERIAEEQRCLAMSIYRFQHGSGG